MALFDVTYDCVVPFEVTYDCVVPVELMTVRSGETADPQNCLVVYDLCSFSPQQQQQQAQYAQQAAAVQQIANALQQNGVPVPDVLGQMGGAAGGGGVAVGPSAGMPGPMLSGADQQQQQPPLVQTPPSVGMNLSPAELTEYLNNMDQSIDTCRDLIGGHWDDLDLDGLLDFDDASSLPANSPPNSRPLESPNGQQLLQQHQQQQQQAQVSPAGAPGRHPSFGASSSGAAY